MKMQDYQKKYECKCEPNIFDTGTGIMSYFIWIFLKTKGDCVIENVTFFHKWYRTGYRSGRIIWSFLYPVPVSGQIPKNQPETGI